MAPPVLHHRYSLPVISCSSSSLKQVEPPTTKTTSPSFSDYEPPSLTDSSIPPQLQILHESFLSPLTETNLEYHKSTFPSSREAKKKYVELYIHHQQQILEQELELQRQIKLEVAAMMPLDTTDQEHELIPDKVPAKKKQTNHHGKPRWFKSFAQWVLRKKKNHAAGRQPVFHPPPPPRTSPPTPPLAMPLATQPHALDNHAEPVPPTRRQHSASHLSQQQRAARHVSWCVGSSYEDYKQEKLRLVQQQLNDLGSPRPSTSSAHPPWSPTLFVSQALPDPPSPHMLTQLPPLPMSPVSSDEPSSPTTPNHPAVTDQKSTRRPTKDSAISFLQHTRSLLRTRRLSLIVQPQPAKDVQGATRRHSLGWSLGQGKDDQDQMPLPPDELKAFRYPRMIPRQVMRDTALQMLLYQSQSVEPAGSQLDPLPFYTNDDTSNTTTSSYSNPIYSQRYHEPIQQQGLTAPPFPIGRPLSASLQ